MTKKNAGFTLIELLIVIAVIGVIAGVVLIAVNPVYQLQKSRDAGRRNNMRQIANALRQYHTLNGKMPINRAPGRGYWSYEDNFLKELLDGGYLKMIPKDPSNYSYGYYDYGAGSQPGALIIVDVESIPNTTNTQQYFPESCRPFNTGNWCDSTIANKQYCICVTY